MKKVLLVAEDPAVSASLDHMLQELNCRCSHVTSLAQAQQLAASVPYDLILCHALSTADPLAALCSQDDGCPIIVTGLTRDEGSVINDSARRVHFLPDSQDFAALHTVLHEILVPAVEEQADSANAGSDSEPLPGMIGFSAAMREVYRRIRKVAPTKSTVLIRGETGTGKELVAKAIHDASSRARKPFIAVNCAAIPETLIESELFGHEKGSFTGAASKRSGLIEAAEGGTLFLDEIGELPPDAQARLLRFIQESEIRRIGSNTSQPVDVRLIAATHRDLQGMTRTGEFRADLYYRINVFRIFLPALRERGNDLLQIAEHLLDVAATRHQKPQLYLSQSAMLAIRQYDWPGNIRELENVIERAAIMADQPEITPYTLEIDVHPQTARQRPENASSSTTAERPQQAPGGQDSDGDQASQEELSLEEYFQRFVLENQEQMNETELAKKLGISRKCLWERRQRFGIPRQKNGKTSSSA